MAGRKRFCFTLANIIVLRNQHCIVQPMGSSPAHQPAPSDGTSNQVTWLHPLDVGITLYQVDLNSHLALLPPSQIARHISHSDCRILARGCGHIHSHTHLAKHVKLNPGLNKDTVHKRKCADLEQIASDPQWHGTRASSSRFRSVCTVQQAALCVCGLSLWAYW